MKERKRTKLTQVYIHDDAYQALLKQKEELLPGMTMGGLATIGMLLYLRLFKLGKLHEVLELGRKTLDESPRKEGI